MNECPEKKSLRYVILQEKLNFSLWTTAFYHLNACLSLFFFLSTQDEEGFYGSYTIDNPLTCTAYEFQVRCACDRGLMSDWSEIHRIQGIETSKSSL